MAMAKGPDRELLKRYLSYIPKFLGLLVNLLRDPRVSAGDKAILGATVAYLLNPVDLVPDWIPFLGLVDDLYLIALAVMRLLLRTDEAVIREHWHGPGDVIATVRQAAELAVAFLPHKIKVALLERVEPEPQAGNTH